jgi:hypothetical protein
MKKIIETLKKKYLNKEIDIYTLITTLLSLITMGEITKSDFLTILKYIVKDEVAIIKGLAVVKEYIDDDTINEIIKECKK